MNNIGYKGNYVKSLSGEMLIAGRNIKDIDRLLIVGYGKSVLTYYSLVETLLLVSLSSEKKRKSLKMIS